MIARLVLLAAMIALVGSSVEGLTSAAAYREACRLSRYTCKDIPAPKVRESVFVDKSGAYGFYFGGRTIWVATYLTPRERYVVMVHEMVHYLQVYEDQKGFPHNAPFETCVREEEAYEVSDQVLARLGTTERLTPRLAQFRALCA